MATRKSGKKLKPLRKCAGVLAFVSFLCTLGTVGAADLGYMSTGRLIIQSGVFCLALILFYWLAKTGGRGEQDGTDGEERE